MDGSWCPTIEHIEINAGMKVHCGAKTAVPAHDERPTRTRTISIGALSTASRGLRLLIAGNAGGESSTWLLALGAANQTCAFWRRDLAVCCPIGMKLKGPLLVTNETAFGSNQPVEEAVSLTAWTSEAPTWKLACSPEYRSTSPSILTIPMSQKACQ